MRLLTVFVCAFNLAAVATAQTGPQAAKIPACVLPCDTKAIATTTCNSTDIPCHCQQKNQILTSIIPCVLSGSNCTDPVQDLYTFESLFAIVCVPYNISIPQNATSIPSTGNASVTSTSLPTPISSAFSNDAARIPLWLGIF